MLRSFNTGTVGSPFYRILTNRNGTKEFSLYFFRKSDSMMTVSFWIELDPKPLILFSSSQILKSVLQLDLMILLDFYHYNN